MATSFKNNTNSVQQPSAISNSTGSGIAATITGMEVLPNEIITSTTNPQLIFPETDRVQIDFGLSENDVLLSYVEQIAPLLGNRGINPLRPEILLESEFLPLSTGETSQTSDISLNFGNQDSQSSNLTQAARLIELHRILRELAHSNASSLLDEYFSLSQEQISAAIAEGVIGFEIVFEKICDTTNGEVLPRTNMLRGGSGSFLNRLSSGSISPSESIELLVSTILTYSDYFFSEIEADNVEITNLRELFDSFKNNGGFNNQLSKIVSIMLIKILSKTIGVLVAKLVEVFDEGRNDFSLSGVRLLDVINYWSTNGPSSQFKFLTTSQVGHHLVNYDSELKFEDSYLPVGTGFENYSNGSNISSLLSVLSNLYSSCMFFRTPNEHGFSPHDGDYSKIVFRSDGDEPGRDGDRSISNSIHLLKQLTPTSRSFLKVAHPSEPGVSNDRYSMLNDSFQFYHGGGLLSFDSSRKDFSISNIDKIIKYAASEDAANDIDSGLANIFAAICFDQVVAANCNAANLDSRYKAIVGTSYKPFPALEGLSELLFKIVDYGPVTSAPDFFTDSHFYNVKAKVSEEQAFFDSLLNSDDLGDLLESTLKVSGLNENLASGNIAYSPIETIANKYGSPGYSYYILDALINNDPNVTKLGDFIDEYEEHIEFISSFVFDIFGLGFENDGSVVTATGNGTVINDLSPMSYFYYYCNQYSSDLERLLNDYSSGEDETILQHAINLAFFSQAGSSVSLMIQAFKSAFFGMFAQDIYEIFARQINRTNSSDSEKEEFKRNINENFVASTEDYLYNMLRHLGLSKDEIRDGSRKFKFNRDLTYKKLLSKGDDIGSDEKQNIIDNWSKMNKKSKAFGGLSRGPNTNYTTYNVMKRIGDRDQFKITLRQALGVYGTTHSDKYFAHEPDSDSSRTVTRGIRPTYKSKFLEKIVQNVPIMGGLGANAGQSVTVHGAKLSSKNEMRQLPDELDDDFNRFFMDTNPSSGSYLALVQNTGQFGGIFNTTTFQRAAMIYMYFMRLAYRSNRVFFDSLPDANGNRGEIKMKNYNTGTRGALTALKLDSVSDFDFEDTNDMNMAINGFSEARYMMRLVEEAIERKRQDILSPIMLLKAHVRKLRLYHDELKSVLNISLDSYSWKELVASRFVMNNSFINNFALFNKDIFVPTIQKRLINNFGSNSLTALSDTFILNDLKCMFKVITGGSSDFGLNSNQALGRKKIMHIGIPAGMLSSLQAVCATNAGDEIYRDSTMIAIHISKKDYLNDEVEYYPRTFIFNMRKHISPLKDAFSGELSNHLLNFSDTSNYEDILQSVEFFTTDQDGNFSSLGTGLSAFPSNDNVYSQLNPHRNSLLKNHVWDYYLRLYTRILAGLDIDEEAFNIKFEDGFFGSPDADMTQDYQDFVNKILELYPSANVNQEASQMFFRTFQVARNRLNFNVNNRLDSIFSGKVFDRIFSVVINERDFLPCKEAFGIEYSDIFEQSPAVNATAATQIKTTKFTVEELQNLTANGKLVDDATGDSEITVKLDEYVKSLNPDHTHLSSYSVEVSLLKGR